MLFTLGFLGLQAQQLSQTLRGKVQDFLTGAPISGATVVLLGSEPLKGTYTDEEGEFRLENVPLGRQNLLIRYYGYLDQQVSQIQVSSGKEVVLSIQMEESVASMDEVVISAQDNPANPLNGMSTVSARTFDLETTARFAGSRNDPARMASNFAGVSGANDGRNDIIIRGNSPIGLLWRLEGVNIPNPNHFGATGATGGPVSMLNNNLLARSDFMTAAFPAQYGNALAGVFDLNLRSGNDEQHEFLGQVGFNGFELGAEGPLSKKGGASYLINYRYSTLGLLQELGVDFGAGTALPQFQDVNLKVNLPTKKYGRFSVFALGGLSEIDILGSQTDTGLTDLFGDENFDVRPRYRTGVVGVTHKALLGPNTAQTLTLAASQARETTTVDTISRFTREPTFVSGILNETNTYSLVYQLNHRFNPKNNIRAGAYLDLYDFVYQDSSLNPDGETFRRVKNADGRTLMSQAYIQWQHKFSDRLTLNAGLNFLHLSLNEEMALEPRLGLSYQFAKASKLNIGYGLHHQRLPLPIYFLESRDQEQERILSNRDLDFMRSQHIVLGYDQVLGKDFHLKVEAYYQQLSQVPVDSFPSSFSLLNTGTDFSLPNNTFLVNEGRGRNYGLELTFEKFFSKGYYFLFTGSLFDSKYEGRDGVIRNTAFNGRYVVNALAGKEINLGKSGKHSVAVDWKITLAGGRFVTPIDIEASRRQFQEVLIDERAFSEQFDDYFRTDIKFTYRFNGKKFTQEFSLDIQNVTDRQNIFRRTFNPRTGEIGRENQLGLFIVPQFRILF